MDVANTQGRKRAVLAAVYLLATIQFVWCYLWLTRPYVNTALYEQGLERMPFQGRILMMLPMRVASHSTVLDWLTGPFGRSHFWFPKPVAPEVMVQAAIDVGCLLLTGWLTTKIYAACSSRQLLTAMIYPLLLVVCGATYMMHTVQNFRFLYDLPSLAFFATAMYLMYFRRHWAWFAALFCVATLNRETTLLLLPLYVLNGAVEQGRFAWRRVVNAPTLAVVVPLAAFWIGWQIVVRHTFAQNPSEFYPRLDWNLKSLAAPLAWPQLLSAGGYLLLFVLAMRRRIVDPRLRAWLWIVPVWLVFMFVYGILIETRVFGELIPLIVCASAVIVEEILLDRMRVLLRRPGLAVVQTAAEIREAA
jgi:hypothetical protein